MNKIFKKENYKQWILFLVTFLIALISYSYLPEQIPVHFDIAGNVDRYAGRIYIFLAPFVILIMNIFAELFKNVDPKREAYNKFNKQYYMIFLLVSLLMMIIQLYTIAFSLNIKIMNISILMPFAVGLLFAIIGNYMPKFKQNFYAGIRTSWTLSDEEVWFKTHRLGGKIWFAGGIAMMVSAILPSYLKMKVFLGIVIIITLIPIIYSYIAYKNKFK
ncbi:MULTISPECIES: SdpI family protein [unclassified Sedimentibacter]|uniref:SdpI family protein n=1 Tax=unclassified Sedimentibacter TaxID=2649220 RepID=UPI0027E04D8F|nr:SdpI family protein [Sedimentibacter sp. MB35-C1]WMJ78883.1 SdpI family protein [Sedimentibacter sp. MB35-C1]